MYENLIENDKTRKELDKLRDQLYDRILNAQDEFQLAKADCLGQYLAWRYELLEEK